MNKIILKGKIERDPTLNTTTRGVEVCNFRISTKNVRRGEDNNLIEEFEYHNIVVWGKRAVDCANMLTQGDKVFIEGSVKTKVWSKGDQTNRTSEVHVQDITFLDQR